MSNFTINTDGMEAINIKDIKPGVFFYGALNDEEFIYGYKIDDIRFLTFNENISLPINIYDIGEKTLCDDYVEVDISFQVKRVTTNKQ